jgi:tetratricopeptide (TPR) repeat protein
MLPRMLKRPSISFLFVLFPTVLLAQSQSAPKSSDSKTDHSQEAFVIEQFSCREKFENDGTSSQEVASRVRVQSEAGVHQFGVLNFSYASGTGTFEIAYVRVRKADGSVVETPSENMLDMPAQITREAPFYSDLHEKQVAVKGLSAGDVLEYQTLERTTKPLAAGQFWTAYQFAHDPIVLDEELEIKVPRERTVKLRSLTVQPVISEADGYKIYTWHSANLAHKDDAKNKRESTEKVWQQARGRLPRSDVLISSFTSWQDVAHWYGGLQDERVKPGPEVTAKAVELTKNAATDEEKTRVLYGYVSTKFRYIGIAFGIGRYQPHTAAEVLANQYGDCKDKHTLLASLLTAVGIPAYPALISASSDVDQDVPSPGQFDHVITLVPGKGEPVWLDTTSEVGPYQYLLPQLRDKRALAIFKDKPSGLVTTPVNLPFETTQKFDLKGKVSDTGTLEGHADFYARGDVEYALRSAFRTVPLPQWKELAQRISAGWGFGGEVSDVTASSPEKTDELFHFSYNYTRKNFGDWANQRTLSALPLITLPASREEDELPLGPTWLGSPSDIDFKSEVEFPAGYRADFPAATHWKRDFAEYDASYSFKDGKFTSERHMRTLLQEVPSAERDGYKQLAKTLEDEYGNYVPLISASNPTPAASGSVAPISSMNSLQKLPDSTNEEAMRLEKEAQDAVARREPQSAESALYRAVAADPKFTRAWVFLGRLLFSQKQKDAGIDALRKAIASDPQDVAIPKLLGFGLMMESQFSEAIPVWQDFIKAHPNDADGPLNLGSCFLQMQKYTEAAAVFEVAIKTLGDRPDMESRLGSVYLHAGDREKASAAFSKIAGTTPDSGVLNDTAYEMAEADLNLPVALTYAKKAVSAAAEESQKIAFPDLKLNDLAQIFKVAAYWDTLGWIDKRMSNFDEAESYLQASWKLTQDGVVAGHLCQLYQQLHRPKEAIQMCRLALYRIPITGKFQQSQNNSDMDIARKTLDHLASGTPAPKKSLDESETVIKEREFKLPRLMPGTLSAEFFVLLVSEGKGKSFQVEDVKFISGSEKLKPQGKQLKTIDFHISAPSDIPVRFVRRGILGCYEYTGCNFVLLDPAAVQSLQ